MDRRCDLWAVSPECDAESGNRTRVVFVSLIVWLRVEAVVDELRMLCLFQSLPIGDETHVPCLTLSSV
jgi:hypothetical protein